jgi:hypothetical protein
MFPVTGGSHPRLPYDVPPELGLRGRRMGRPSGTGGCVHDAWRVAPGRIQIRPEPVALGTLSRT